MIKYPVYKPFLCGNEKKYVNDCLDSSWISSKGKYIDLFKDSFKDFLKVNNATPVSNGTVALHLAMLALDIKEGADLIMIKPGLPYLDIIKSIKDNFKIPVFAYQVSGEYSLISNAIQKKLVNEDAVVESLMAFKRAGANAIVSYYADKIDKILK